MQNITFICKNDMYPMILTANGKYSPYYKCDRCSNKISLNCATRIRDYIFEHFEKNENNDRSLCFRPDNKHRCEVHYDVRDDYLIALIER